MKLRFFAGFGRFISLLVFCALSGQVMGQTAPVVFGAWYGTETAQFESVGPLSVAARIKQAQPSAAGAVLVPANMNSFFNGDPVPGQPKVVAVFVTHGGINYNLRQTEGKVLRFPGVEGQDYTFGKLDIVSASYSSTLSPAGATVTNRVVATVKNGVITVPANMNYFFGTDPAPGQPKQFSVILRNLGKLYDFRQVEGKEFRFPGVLGQDFTMAATPTLPTPATPATPGTTGTTTASAEPTEIFEDVPDMPEMEVQMVMDWIKNRSTSAKLPFCWKQSDPRGVGTIPGRIADCPAGYTNNGATCGRGADSISAPSRLANCPAGYTNTGLTCFRPADTIWKGCKRGGCPAGYTDNGCTCGRGAHSPLVQDASVCPDGFHKEPLFGRCNQNCPAGYTNTGETCLRNVSTLGISGMLCKPGEERIGARCLPQGKSCYGDEESSGGLCYRNCKPGFNGEGPVCWQQCQAGWVNCGAGCAKSSAQCAMTVADQVIAPLVVAANLATLGMSSGGATAIQGAVTLGPKTYSASTRAGRALAWMVGKLRSVNALDAGVPLTRRIYNAKMGAQGAGTLTKLRKVGMTTFSVASNTYQSVTEFAQAFADDFATQTSPEINDIINKNFHPDTARFLKETWARQQFMEMASVEGWIAADSAMGWVGMVDVTGVTSLVGAYAKPICQDPAELPCTSASLNCKSVFANLQPPAPVELKTTPLSSFSCWDNCADLSRGFTADTANKVCGNAAQCESMCGIAGTAKACLSIQPAKITLRECAAIPGADCGSGAAPPPVFNCAAECTTTEGLCANLGKCSRQCNGVLKWGEGQIQGVTFNPLTWDQRAVTAANVCFTKGLLTAEICAANSPAKRCRTVLADPPPGPVRVPDGSKSMVAIPPKTFAYLAQGDAILSEQGTAMMRMDPNGVLSTYYKEPDWAGGLWKLAGSLSQKWPPKGGNYFAQMTWEGQLCVSSGDPTGVYKQQYCIRNRAEPIGRYQLTVRDADVSRGEVPAIELHVLENIEGLLLRKSEIPNYNSVADRWQVR